MTMPHLINCDHSDDGWCLDCVKRLHDEYEELFTASEKLLNRLDIVRLRGYVGHPLIEQLRRLVNKESVA